MPKQLNSRSKEFVLLLIRYFKEERSNKGPLLPLTAVRERVAAALNLNISTLSAISQAAKNYEVWKSPTKKRSRSKSVTNTITLNTSAIRNIIYNMYKTTNLLLVSVGICLVWTSPMISHLKSNNTETNPLGAPISTIQISIIASIPLLASLLCALIVAKISDKIGRKKLLQYISVLFIVILVTLSFATHVYVYYVCFFILGSLYAGTYINVAVYNNEIAEDRNRGNISGFVSLAIQGGSLFGYIFGSLTNVKSFTLICAIPAALYLVLSPIIRESPNYLALVGKKSEALKSLQQLRGPVSYKDVEIEYQYIEEYIKSSKKINKPGVFDLFATRVTIKALGLSMLTYTAQQFSGTSFISSFMAPIFNEAGLTLSGNNVSILVGSVQVIVCCVSAYYVDILGRRQLILCSSSICLTSIFFLGFYFYLKNIHYALIENFSWVPIVCIIIFVISYALGLGPIPLILATEFFPAELKSLGLGVLCILSDIIVSTILFSSPLISESYGMHFTLWTYSGISLICFVLMFLYIPETKGKSLKDIQGLL